MISRKRWILVVLFIGNLFNVFGLTSVVNVKAEHTGTSFKF